ncbi:MAG TPA: HAD family hydrolase [Candidatus Dormibacteraeota bacterium]|nr:HAD family hydrolase [Candidatus Dormibacteraeota bacterium]
MPLLLCDLDDTLLDRAGPFRRWSEAFLRKRGVYSPEHLEWMLKVDDRGRIRRWQMLDEVRRGLRLKETADEMLKDYEATFAGEFTPVDPAVAGALDRARASGWKVGVVTNGDQIQAEKMTQAGLWPHVDQLIASDLEGVQKPDPELFRIAARRLGGTLEGAWMLGDQPVTDIAGAIAAKIDSVWVRPDPTWPDHGFSPTLIADSTPQAIDMVLDRASQDGHPSK